MASQKKDPSRKFESARAKMLGKAQQSFGKQTPAPAKRGLGPTDSGETQRVDGLKAAGKKYTGSLGAAATRQTKSAVMSKKSKGGAKTPKR
jgi:hypothetical protein